MELLWGVLGKLPTSLLSSRPGCEGVKKKGWDVTHTSHTAFHYPPQSTQLPAELQHSSRVKSNIPALLRLISTPLHPPSVSRRPDDKTQIAEPWGLNTIQPKFSTPAKDTIHTSYILLLEHFALLDHVVLSHQIKLVFTLTRETDPKGFTTVFKLIFSETF